MKIVNGWTKNIPAAMILSIIVIAGNWLWFGGGVCKDIAANTKTIGELLPKAQTNRESLIQQKEQFKSIENNQERLEEKLDNILIRMNTFVTIQQDQAIKQQMTTLEIQNTNEKLEAIRTQIKEALATR